jgi:guanylate kinase
VNAPGDAPPSARLVVLSGPSGVGKSTVVDWLRRHAPQLWVSVSATTRPARPGERDGVNYRFVTGEQFDELVADGALLEWAEFAGNRYGTPRSPVEKRLARGAPVLLEIELEGARQVRQALPDLPGVVYVFLAPPSWEVLRDRLVGRGTEPPDVVSRRLDRAQVELAAADEFDLVLVNDDVAAVGEALLDLVGGSAE